MRIGLLGDIHGNAQALSVVLDAARHRNLDVLCISGDFIGYYYEPDAIFRLLHDWVVHAVRGNHEDMFLKYRKDQNLMEQYRQKYGSGLYYANKLLTSKDINYIKNLPTSLIREFDGKKLLLAHGAPWDTNFYLSQHSPSTIWDRVAEIGVDYVVLGHTHFRFTKRIKNTIVINPGSVGQPRDRLPGAAWAVLDSKAGICEHFTESYDIDHVIGQARVNDPHSPYLWEVLTRT